MDETGPVPPNVGMRRRATLAAIALIATLAAVHASALGYRGDDGAITFQYVKNVLGGHGLVYAVGERVEGYSNFLWVVLLSLSSWLTGIDVARVAPVLGVGLSMASVALVHRIAVRWHGWGAMSLFAPSLLALATPFAVWAPSGLEVPLFSTLVLGAVAARLGPTPRFAAAGVFLGLAAITRPEGALFAGMALGYELVTRDGEGGARPGDARSLSRTARAIRLMVPVISLLGPQLIFRRLYYGEWAPNTYFAKVDFGWGVARRGVSYLGKYGLLFSFTPYVLAAVGAASAFRDRRLAYPALFVPSYLAWVVSVGGDGLVMFRFVAHVLPLLCLLMAEGTVRVVGASERALGLLGDPRYQLAVRDARSGARKLGRLSLGLLGPTLAIAMGWPSGLLLLRPDWPWMQDDASQLPFPNPAEGFLWFDQYFSERVAMAGRFLDTHAPPHALIAANPGGIAFYMRQPALDMLGLNDRFIARRKSGAVGRAGHDRGDGAYVLSREPECVLLGNVAVLPFPLDEGGVEARLYLRSELELWSLPEFHRAYERVTVELAPSGSFRYFTFYRRRHPRSVE